MGSEAEKREDPTWKSMEIWRDLRSSSSDLLFPVTAPVSVLSLCVCVFSHCLFLFLSESPSLSLSPSILFFMSSVWTQEPGQLEDWGSRLGNTLCDGKRDVLTFFAGY